MVTKLRKYIRVLSIALFAVLLLTIAYVASYEYHPLPSVLESFTATQVAKESKILGDFPLNKIIGFLVFVMAYGFFKEERWSVYLSIFLFILLQADAIYFSRFTIADSVLILLHETLIALQFTLTTLVVILDMVWSDESMN
jgi:hypothetical protein